MGFKKKKSRGGDEGERREGGVWVRWRERVSESKREDKRGEEGVVTGGERNRGAEGGEEEDRNEGHEEMWVRNNKREKTEKEKVQKCEG